MRVLYPVSEVFPNPTARSIQIMNTCAALARRGHQVVLLLGKKRAVSAGNLLDYYGLLPTPGLEIEFLPILRSPGQGIWRPSWGGLFLFFCRRRIARLLAGSVGKKDTVIFVRHLKLAGALCRRNKKFLAVPLVFEAHEIFSHGKPVGSRLRMLEEKIYNGVNGVVAITAHLAGMIQENFALSKPLAVVPDGTNLFPLSPLNSQTPARVVYAGQLYDWKGVDCLVEAMAEVPGARLVILGGGAGGREELQRKCRSLGVEDRVDFLGQVPHREVEKYLREADVFALPSATRPISCYWTSPLKLFEYMATGRPVVASDLPSLREILRHEENALLVEPGNPRAMAAAINRILTDRGLAQRLAGQALADVREYTWDKRAEKLEGFFFELLS